MSFLSVGTDTVKSSQEKTPRARWPVPPSSPKTADPIGTIWMTRRKPCWKNGLPSLASGTMLWAR